MATDTTTVPRASMKDTAAVAAGVLGPLVARGVIKRRRRMTELSGRLDVDRRAVQQLQGLRRRYGPGPLLLRVPGRSIALILDPDDVHRVLAETPEPFAAANLEKRAALGHFQPHGVLISHGDDRAERRRFNEDVLDTGRRHRLAADGMVAKAHEEATAIAELAVRLGHLDYDDFMAGWWRMVRRVVLGEWAADDHTLTDQLAALRDDANWAYLRPKRDALRHRFLERLEAHVTAAEPGSLAQLVAGCPSGPATAAVEQVPQWLFAFDAAAMATFRALALASADREHHRRLLDEVGGRDLQQPHDLPLARATVLESVRLWPTTPAVLRDTTRQTDWATGTLPAGTLVLVYAPLFHRDDEHLVEAHRLAPELWLDGRSTDGWPLIPFSAGPAECAGKDVVLLLTSVVLATIAARCRVRLRAEAQLEPEAFPGTLSPFSLQFAVSAS